jgi:hypothetical protein
MFSVALISAQGVDEIAPTTPSGSSTEAARESGPVDLAKKLANPLANLISLPFQTTWTSGVGPNDDTAFILKLQPIVPFALNGTWSLITRTIVPMMSQPVLVPGSLPASGIGDIQFSAFLSPATAGAITWGAGPILSLPSTNEPTLGTQKWSAGPTAAVIVHHHSWTYGAVWNQIWSFAGNTDRADVNQMFVQPFASYTTRSAITFGVNLEATAHWQGAGDSRWTAPVNLQVSKLSTFGPLPASYSAGFGWYVTKPVGAPSWQVRSGLTLLLPRR